MRCRVPRVSAVLTVLFLGALVSQARADRLKDLQAEAVSQGKAEWGHWGANPDKYSTWTSHSNRLIPVYTFGLTLESVNGANSPYRHPDRIEKLYGRLPDGTVNDKARYFDQTDVYHLQKMAVDAGKKHIVLIVFDGMDWQTTWAAATARAGKVNYRVGRGTGLHFQDYRGVETDFGYFVTSPHNSGTSCDVNTQTVKNPGGDTPGGYDAQRGGAMPWETGNDPLYIIAQSRDRKHAYTDSSSSASSLTAGIKTYNNGVNVDANGRQVSTIAWELQDRGMAIGVVSSVPISHATPACAYSNNVHRDDYQDLTRDLIGLPSIAHRSKPLPGVDVLIGAGWGESSDKAPGQGDNFVPGNLYITDEDLKQIDVANGGRYRVVQRQSGVEGAAALAAVAEEAASQGQRLFGYFGVAGAHLPYRTADGNYDPTVSATGPAEVYSPADVRENPTLADMTKAALTVLSKDPDGFWLMVESGDVDWANHANNLDNSIGAVHSGDDAFRAVTEWVEANNRWSDTAVIVTSDHGHYLVLTKPEMLVEPQPARTGQ